MKKTIRNLLLTRHIKMPHWLRASRYVIGSAICFAVSELVLMVLFLVGAGAWLSAALGSIAGVFPGYYLNRTWTWGRKGKSDFWREIVPYWTIALISTLVSAFGTKWANDTFISQSRFIRTGINMLAYLLIYGVIFVVKYILFHTVLFRPDRTEQKEKGDSAIKH